VTGTSGAGIEPFRIDVADAVLDDLRDRLHRTRFSGPSPDGGWGYGTELGHLQELCRYWADEYDWRAQEAAINAHDQFVTEIDGQRVHFLHVRSPEPGALPLVLTHGWPGSIVEFLKVIGPLTDPAAHGGDAADAFHVVVPALPGYGFSGPTSDPGWDVRRIAEAWAVLMARLGYERYGAQGGDWGAMVSTQLLGVDAENLVGVHLNMVIAGPGPDDLNDLTEAETLSLGDMGAYMDDGFGYAKIQQTRPQSVGYGLDDSPAGLAAWIVEKFRAWSDCDGDVESVFTRDELLTNVMLYWVTATASSSARLYYESTKSGRFGTPLERVDVPVGGAIFPKEIVRPSRRWAEQHFNIVHWTDMPQGGHFAAFEQPELLVEDVRAFFRPLR
jgi:pimeloyl-ACP methyl ester carboxylesterase